MKITYRYYRLSNGFARTWIRQHKPGEDNKVSMPSAVVYNVAKAQVAVPRFAFPRGGVTVVTIKNGNAYFCAEAICSFKDGFSKLEGKMAALSTLIDSLGKCEAHDAAFAEYVKLGNKFDEKQEAIRLREEKRRETKESYKK